MLRTIYLPFFLVFGLLAACGGGGGSGVEPGQAIPATGGASGGAPGLAVPLYRIFERSVTNSGNYANKFTDVALDVTYTSPSGRQLTLPGFYDGDGNGRQNGDVWKFRFMPDEPGAWSYSYSWSDGTPGGSGELLAVTAGAGRGILKAYDDNPRWFAYNGTDPVFIRSYHVGSAGTTGLPIGWAAANIYAKLASRGYNHVMLKTLPIAWTDEKPADAPGGHIAKPLWSRTPDTQDLQVWKRFEEHMKWLNDRDIGVFFFMGFDPKGGSSEFFAQKRWTSLSSSEQDSYVRYVAARLAPFANVAGWNYTWETDGNSGERQLMDLLEKYDPWGHLKTYHDEEPASNQYDDSRYSFAGIENHGYFGNHGGTPAHDSASHYQATIDAHRGKPVYMVEGNGLWRGCWAKSASETSITRAAWAVTLAGGSFVWDDSPSCNKGPASAMLSWPSGNPIAKRLDVLYTVMTKEVEFHRMTPQNELLGGCASSFSRSGAVPGSPCYALAEEGRQYLIYKEDGGSFSVNLSPGGYSATWIDTRSGARQAANGGSVQASGVVQFTAPSTSTDWVLLLKAPS